MDRAHQAFDDAELVVNNLCQRRQAVGRARCIGDLASDGVRLVYMRLKHTYHSVFGVVRVKVNPDDKHRGIRRRRGDDDLLSTTLQMGRCSNEDNSVTFTDRLRKYSLIDGGENTRRLNDVVGANRTPLDVGRIALLEDRDAETVDDKLSVPGLHFTLEAAVDRVVLEHVDLNLHS